MTEAQARAAGLTEEQIAALKLDSGGHTDPEAGHCLLEVVSMLVGEEFSDEPQCVDPVLRSFGISWNDRLDDVKRQELKRYIPILVGTNKGPELSARRAFMALDWLWREHAAMWMADVPELAEHAAKLRALAPITAELGEAERTAAIDLVGKAAWAAWAARDAWAARAAWDAWDAWDARAAWDAWDARAARAAWAARAARDAWAAAAYAAQTQAYEAAKGSASYEEARAKADAVFDKHRDAVHEQLHGLYLRMINAELREMAEKVIEASAD